MVSLLSVIQFGSIPNVTVLTVILHTISGHRFQAFVALHTFHIFQHILKIPNELFLHVKHKNIL